MTSKTTAGVQRLLRIRPELTEEQAFEVFEAVMSNGGDDGFGCTSDTLEFWASRMYPLPKPANIYTVEIVETLQKQVAVEAVGESEAVFKVKAAYGRGAYILGAEQFTSVDIHVYRDEEQLGLEGLHG